MKVWVQGSGHSSLKTAGCPEGDLFTPCRPPLAQGEWPPREGMVRVKSASRKLLQGYRPALAWACPGVGNTFGIPLAGWEKCRVAHGPDSPANTWLCWVSAGRLTLCG